MASISWREIFTSSASGTPGMPRRIPLVDGVISSSGS
ncbi:Uncharacterised protein [Vibrio cholerae]|nr:Uncharacterised protein [Vibrio cholerae]